VNFTRIKCTDKETALDWSEVNEKGTAHNHTIESKEAPNTALPAALKALVPLVAVACELPEPWEQGMAVTQISLSTEHSKGKPPRRGLIVTFQYKPEGFISRMTCNTPLLREALDDAEEGEPGFIPDSWDEPIAAIEEAAAKFALGHRFQEELPLMAGAAK
jgi:hypothetical protein